MAERTGIEPRAADRRLADEASGGGSAGGAPGDDRAAGSPRDRRGGWPTWRSVAVVAVLVVVSVVAAREWVDTGASDGPQGGAASSPAEDEEEPLSWPPPPLDQPLDVSVTDDDRRLRLDPARDHVLHLPAEPLDGGLKVVGGRNVVLIGGEIRVDWQGPDATTPERRGLLVSGQTGTVHVEGVLFSGSDLTEAIQIAAPQAVVQIQNVRVEGIRARDQEGFTDNHPDLVQPWGGVEELRIDRLTGVTDYQGIFLKGEGERIGPVTLRNVDIHGDATARYLLWAEPDIDVEVDDVYAEPAEGRSWGATVEPERPHRMWRQVRAGTPPDGPFVPAGSVGVGYRSPFELDRGSIPADGDRSAVDDRSAQTE